MMHPMTIPLDQLFISTLNVRKTLGSGEEDSGIGELAESIRAQGLLSPLTVRRAPDGRHEILVGQRRFLACRKIALDPVPCLVREGISDADAMTLSLVENVHRADMHPLDKAQALKGLYDRYGSYERVSRESGWSVSTIRKYLHLLALPADLQERISTANGTAGVAVLARLATTFSGGQADEVYNRISGFNQRIQEEILKRSNGDIESIEDLVDEAHDGAFDARRCGGPHGCEVVRDILERQITQADFQQIVEAAAARLKPADSKDRAYEAAARAFWKALAAGA